jgi:hypothetical protein
MIYAKIYTENGKLVCESLTNDIVKDIIYPAVNGRIGTVVIDTEKHLSITKDAVDLLKKIMHKARKNGLFGGDTGDISFFESDYGYCFSWFGDIRRVIDPEDKIYIANDTIFHEGKFVAE